MWCIRSFVITENPRQAYKQGRLKLYMGLGQKKTFEAPLFIKNWYFKKIKKLIFLKIFFNIFLIYLGPNFRGLAQVAPPNHRPCIKMAGVLKFRWIGSIQRITCGFIQWMEPNRSNHPFWSDHIGWYWLIGSDRFQKSAWDGLWVWKKMIQ